jgi:enoyl-CoA hydratase
MTQPTTYALDGKVATITMDDGKVNAFSIEMLQALHADFDRAETDGAVVVLTGRENRFSAGFDLGVFGGGDAERVVEMLRLGATLIERIFAFPRPVVVACNGHAVAAGAFVAMAADARIGVDGPFQIGLNEVKIGLTMPWFVVELARYRMQPSHFDRAVVTASMYSPADAVAAGFLDRVVAPDELQATALETAATLAELNLDAHAATKQRARGAALEKIRAAIESELTLEGLSGDRAPA